MNNTSASEETWDTNGGNRDGLFFRFISCVFSGTSSKRGEFKQHNSTASVPGGFELGFINCIFNDIKIRCITFGGSSSVVEEDCFVINCYWHNTTLDCIEAQYDTTRKKWARSVFNTIFNLNSSGQEVYVNTDNGNDLETNMNRNCNRVWLRGGGLYATWQAGINIDAAFTFITDFDDFASSGDPDIVSDSDPTLNDTSLLVDKGCLINEVLLGHTIDPFGLGYGNYDALGFFWGDSAGPEAPLISDDDAIFSQRSVGPVQNAKGMIPPGVDFGFPRGVAGAVTVYAVGEVPDDPDGAGTCQFRVNQATDSGFTSGVVRVDSYPLNVTASDNKLNFSEDSGAERTATLAVGAYTTAELLVEIKAKMEAAPSATGTYDVTYDSVAEKMTIAVNGGSATTNVELLLATGTDIGTAIYKWSGFDVADTGQSTSHLADGVTIENLHDSSLTYEYSNTHTIGEDPAVNGAPWVALGTGDPGDAGVEGTDGVECVAGKSVRVNLGIASPMNNKYHSIQFDSGTFQSAPIKPVNT